MKESINNSVCGIHLAELSRNVRERTVKRIETVPDGWMNWRLNNTALSFAHIMQHLIDVDELFFEMMQNHRKQVIWTMGSYEPHTEVDQDSCKKMLNKLKSGQNKREKIFLSLNNADLEQEVMVDNSQKMTLRWFIMDNLIAHEVYHRGQLSAYLKMVKGESLISG
jgi:uncharacterized damage-inducible protein DinB